jgi:hypothetical protein
VLAFQEGTFRRASARGARRRLRRPRPLGPGALLAVLFGVSELVAPVELMRVYGFQLDAGGAAIVRMAAALNVGFGLTVVLSYKTKDTVARRALLVGGVVYGVVAMAVTAHCTLTGAAGPMMWTMAFICVPLAVNAVRLLLAERGAAARLISPRRGSAPPPRAPAPALAGAVSAPGRGG